MNKMAIRRLGSYVAACSVAITVLGTPLAQAQDTKVFHGSSCQARNNSSPSISYDFNGATNNSFVAEEWICPVVRDFNSSNADITDWDITVNRLQNGAWDVQLWSLNTSGFSGFVSTISVPAQFQLHELDGGQITSSFTGGVMLIRSAVPGLSSINRYSVVENGIEP